MTKIKGDGQEHLVELLTVQIRQEKEVALPKPRPNQRKMCLPPGQQGGAFTDSGSGVRQSWAPLFLSCVILGKAPALWDIVPHL